MFSLTRASCSMHLKQFHTTAFFRCAPKSDQEMNLSLKINALTQQIKDNSTKAANLSNEYFWEERNTALKQAHKDLDQLQKITLNSASIDIAIVIKKLTAIWRDIEDDLTENKIFTQRTTVDPLLQNIEVQCQQLEELTKSLDKLYKASE